MQNPPPGPPPGEPPPQEPPAYQPPQYQPPQPEQAPPPQPPQYQPPQQQPAYPPPQQQYSGGTPSTGMNKKTGAIISYVLGWITGLIMLFVGKDDPDIKFHAAQSIVFFGGLAVLTVALQLVGAFFLGGILFFVRGLIGLFGFVMWIVIMVKVLGGQGERFDIPLVGSFVRPYAEQLSNSV